MVYELNDCPVAIWFELVLCITECKTEMKVKKNCIGKIEESAGERIEWNGLDDGSTMVSCCWGRGDITRSVNTTNTGQTYSIKSDPAYDTQQQELQDQQHNSHVKYLPYSNRSGGHHTSNWKAIQIPNRMWWSESGADVFSIHHWIFSIPSD